MHFSRKARRELLLIIFFVCLFSYAYLLTYSSGGFIELDRTRIELGQLELENQQLREINRQKAQQIERMKSDPAELERILREKLDYARPGDVIITLPDNQPILKY